MKACSTMKVVVLDRSKTLAEIKAIHMIKKKQTEGRVSPVQMIFTSCRCAPSSPSLP